MQVPDVEFAEAMTSYLGTPAPSGLRTVRYQLCPVDPEDMPEENTLS